MTVTEEETVASEAWPVHLELEIDGRRARFRRVRVGEIGSMLERYAVWRGEVLRQSIKNLHLSDTETAALRQQVFERALRWQSIYEYAETDKGIRDIVETVDEDRVGIDALTPLQATDIVAHALWLPDPKGRAEEASE